MKNLTHGFQTTGNQQEDAKSRLSEKQLNHMKGLAHEVNSLIQTRQMQPMIRTSYYRCAFQLPTSNALRISLDTTMTLLNEYVDFFADFPLKLWIFNGR